MPDYMVHILQVASLEEVYYNLALINLLGLLYIVVIVVSMWKLYNKAGQPGWTSLIPIYNYVVLLRIINRPIWWIFMLLVPIVNVIFYAIMVIDLAKVFGKGTGFGVLLLIFPYITFPILAFSSSAEYSEPVYVTEAELNART